MPEASRKLYLVDAMSNIHRAYHAIQSLSTSTGRPTNAIYGFVTMLRKMLREHTPELCAVAWDGPERTQRHDVYAGYKANRPTMADDLASQLPEIRKLLAQAEEVAGKVGENLRQTREAALLSRRLVEIPVDLPIPFEPDTLRRSDPDFSKLKDIFVRLEFHSLAAEIQGESAAPPDASMRRRSADEPFAPPPGRVRAALLNR